jgi:amino acid adenylation domain-containing protein/non-ribosomal peptide synthase protein (TIGR01720 family)
MDKRITFSVFEHHAASAPERLAVQDSGGEFTYGQLNQLANRIARSMSAVTTVRGAVVGVLIPNSRMYVAAILAVQKVGGVFLPLGLDTPPLRMQTVLQKAEPGIILVTEETRQALDDFLAGGSYHPQQIVVVGDEGVTSITSKGEHVPLPAIDDSGNLGYFPDPDDDLYIIFTSGSTGVPKAVLGRHKGLAHFCHWEVTEFGFDETLRCSNLSPTTFDVSLRDIFVPLSCGGSVFVPDNDTKTTPAKLANWLGDNRLTLMHIVPSVFRLVLDELDKMGESRDRLYENLHHVLLAGEAVYGRDVARWQGLFKNPAELVNLYGPSETTLAKICNRKLQPTENPTEVIPLGQPIANTAVLILKNGRLAEIGELGEIYIKTPFRSKGYFRDPERTAEAFIVNPLNNDAEDIIYKTGDMGKYLADRGIAFGGRMDRQVKINGVRVELSEVDAAVGNYPGIGTVLTMPHRREDGEVFLICYYTVTAEVDSQALRASLSDSLYSAMVPSFFVKMDSFPLNINGKIDRRALPKPEELLYERGDFVPPEGAVEETLAEIWKSVLSIKTVGVTTSFQELGGNSMQAIRCIGRISQELQKEISIREFFAAASIREIGRKIAGAAVAVKAIPHLPAQPDYAPAHTQKRLWLLQQMLPDFTAYNIPGFFRITGKLDLKKLEAAINKLVERHESLRTVFVEINGELRQRVLDKLPVSLEVFDLRQAADQEAAIRTIAEEYCATVFELDEPPLFRIGIAVCDDEKFVLFFTIHHIISDAWSMQLIMNEAMAFYRQSDGSSLEPPALQYRDYAAWQNEQVAQGLWDKQKKYWLNQLGGELPRLDLPLDYPRPTVQSYAGATAVTNFPASCSQALLEFSSRSGQTPYTVLLALVNALLHRYTGQQDILLNTPVTLRDNTSLHGVIGDFTNALVMRTKVSCEDTFDNLLRQISRNVGEGRENADYPFDLLVEQLEVRRDPSRAPLTDVGITLVESAEFDGSGELRLEPLEVDVSVSKYDLIFHFTQSGGAFTLALEYNTALFRRERMERMSANFLALTANAIANPGLPVRQLECISPEEQELLNQFRRPYVENFEPRTITGQFASIVNAKPASPAVLWDGGSLNYTELDSESNRIANWLLAECSLEVGSRVGVLLKRDHRIAQVLLGILKAGCVYVPFEEEHPAERIRYQAEVASLSVLITEPTLLEKCPAGARTLAFADSVSASTERPEVAITPESEAYIIFTSGSTGRPKGVLLPHCGIVDRARDVHLRLLGDKQWRLTQFASLSFDASVFELLMMLLTGGCTVPVTREVLLDVEKYQELLLRHKVNFILLPPSYLRLLNRAELPTVELIKTAGEAAYSADALHYSQSKTYVNAYGPTEDSVCSSWYQVDPALVYPLGIPIGQPVIDTEILILDSNLCQVPVGVEGELCVSDAGLALEYINQPELTAAAFVPHPFDSRRRMYRTGDRVRWEEDGSILFVGRLDQQVKINGYRIEPGEIETVLNSYGNVETGCVEVMSEGEGRYSLAGYYVPRAGGCDREALRQHLARLLPHYMVPSFLVELGAMPINSSGKINRAALPKPEVASANEAIAARDEAEQVLLSIMQEILKVDSFGIHDNFFSLGIDSIRTIQCVSRLRSQGWEISAGAFFQFPTVAELAPVLKKGVGEIDQSPVTGEIGRTPILEWFFESAFPEPQHFNQSVLLKLKRKLNGAVVRQALNTLLGHHDMLRLTCDGRSLCINGTDMPIPFSEVDLKDESAPAEAVAARSTEIHRLFRFDSSPLLRVVLFRCRDFDRLLLVFHHLVIDGVSWRILMEDFDSALRDILADRKPSLPRKTHSFKTWSEAVARYAAGNTLASEKPYWESVVAQTGDTLKTSGSQKGISRLAETRMKLSRVQGIFASRSEQSALPLLLAAFGVALKKWQGIGKTTILLESHGREPIDPAIDVTRTVGWFTSSWPMVLDLGGESDAALAARRVEEDLAKVPLHGIGYGMLRYLCPERIAPINPAISFNYLGQMDGTGDNDLYELLSTGDESAVSAANHTGESLSAVLLATDEELEIGLSFDAGELAADAVEELLKLYVQELENLSGKMSSLEQTVDYAGFVAGGIDDFLAGI